MKILLDSHVFLWAITNSPRLSPVHRKLFESEKNDLYLSVTSIWEMLIKNALGRLTLPAPPTQYLTRQLEKNRILLLPLRTLHLEALERLPPLHRDPFDRILIAQGSSERMPIATADEQMRQYGAATL